MCVLQIMYDVSDERKQSHRHLQKTTLAFFEHYSTCSLLVVELGLDGLAAGAVAATHAAVVLLGARVNLPVTAHVLKHTASRVNNNLTSVLTSQTTNLPILT